VGRGAPHGARGAPHGAHKLSGIRYSSGGTTGGRSDLCQFLVEVGGPRGEGSGQQKTPLATHQADAIVVAVRTKHGAHRYWLVPSAQAGQLGVLTVPSHGGGWDRPQHGGIAPVNRTLLGSGRQGRGAHSPVAEALVAADLEVTGRPNRLTQLQRQAVVAPPAQAARQALQSMQTLVWEEWEEEEEEEAAGGGGGGTA
jgi:hypothetical protein